MATQEDRSIGSAMSLPQWMKTKINSKFDFEQSDFSPSEIDDSFMIYYPYQRCSSEPKDKLAVLNNTASVATKPPTSIRAHLPDLSRHPAPCQKYLTDGSECSPAQHVVFPSTVKTKSSGIDDGFKGEAAKCGSSIIKVAHQMVSGKVIRGFNIESKDDELPPIGFNPAIRRGSKSLPASPLSSPKVSPKSIRRGNKYFTGPFVDTDKHQGSWILSNLLGKRETISQSADIIAEEEIKNSNPNLAEPNTTDIDVKEIKNKTTIYKPKASELREMNFWSPTSM